jgi:hypothetical protein
VLSVLSMVTAVETASHIRTDPVALHTADFTFARAIGCHLRASDMLEM